MFTPLPIPADLAIWKQREVERLRERFETSTYTANGVLFWQSNDAPVPVDCFRDAFCTAPEAQADACKAHTSAAIARYVEARKTVSADQLAEERFAARAAHGPGVVLVDLFSGERIVT
ncbi:hypothetical protein BAJUN_00830 [Bajunvirus bajun]|uniref:Uncharacterized protein n=1 Tax=Brevundimonas phage vB_BgoS-Bajun TaxID=2948594 RepID=A0A9E7N6L6_9CAUD|nr:hypothetical protein BAJUN_00830 [Brevundimonas phage vB_BgoS-Bajun]